MNDSNRKTGQGSPFYEELDAILGTRTASAPPTLLESSEDNLDGKRIDKNINMRNYYCTCLFV